MYQKWPDQIFLVVNLVFSHYGHFGLGRGGGGFGGGPPPWFLIILKKPCPAPSPPPPPPAPELGRTAPQGQPKFFSLGVGVRIRTNSHEFQFGANWLKFAQIPIRCKLAQIRTNSNSVQIGSNSHKFQFGANWLKFAQIPIRCELAQIQRKNLETLIMNPLKPNSPEFARFRIRCEFAGIQIEFDANLHPDFSQSTVGRNRGQSLGPHPNNNCHPLHCHGPPPPGGGCDGLMTADHRRGSAARPGEHGAVHAPDHTRQAPDPPEVVPACCNGQRPARMHSQTNHFCHGC